MCKLICLVTFAAIGVASLASAATIRVDPDSPTNGSGSSWSNAYHDLQSALTAASSSDEIWVANGIYTPSVRTDIYDAQTVSFSMKDGVRLYGGFEGYSGAQETLRSQRDPDANETVLSGELGDPGDNTDNAYHVVIAAGSSISDSARLNGFTVRDGYAHTDPLHFQGAGISVRNGAWPVIARCNFTHNDGSAAGMRVDSPNDPPESPVQFLDCTFSNNIGTYHGGAVYVYDGAGPCTLVNCVGYDNYSVSTGAFIAAFGGPTTLINCTVTRNDQDAPSSSNGAAVRLDGLKGGAVINCAVWGNTNGDPDSEYHSSIEGAQIANVSNLIDVYNSDVEGLDVFAGNSNIDVDPMFVNAGSDDFRIQYHSNLVNHGGVEIDSSDVMPADVYDIDDDSDTSERLPDRAMSDRQVNSVDCIDIGAHENQVEGTCPGDVTGGSSVPNATVNIDDLLYVLSQWGTPGGVADMSPTPCGNGNVNTDDYMVVINNWGTCPGSFVSSPEIPQWILDCLENCGEDPGCLSECIEEGLQEN